MSQQTIRENQIDDFAVKKIGDTISDATLPPEITSYPNGLLEIQRTRAGGPALVVSNSNIAELQISAANGLFQVDALGRVNGQTINNTTALTAAQKTALTGGSATNADNYHSHAIPTFFHYHGTISNGAQLQIPPGFTADDIHYIVSARHFTINNLLANTSLSWDSGIDENRIVTFEIKQPIDGTIQSVNASLNFFITGYKLGGSQTGGDSVSGATLHIKQAIGYWDGEGVINFSTGQITIVPTTSTFYSINGGLVPKYDYFGDIFDDNRFPAPKVIWSILNENNTTFSGGISDKSNIAGIGNIGGVGAASATFGLMQYTGGVTSYFSATDETKFCGRIGFFAISIASF